MHKFELTLKAEKNNFLLELIFFLKYTEYVGKRVIF